MLNTWLQEPATIFSPRGKKVTVNLYRHRKGFPFDDPWGIGARQAWARIKTHGLTVAYLGVGAGAEVVQTLTNRQTPRTMLLNDIVHRNLLVCRANVARAMRDTGLSGLGIAMAEGRAEVILEDLASREGRCLDLITGCLPQVPDLGRPNAEQIAHVYPLKDYPQLPEWGFGLLHAVLEAAQVSLNRQGCVSLVVSGRVPWKAVIDLFQRTGFQTPKIVHRFMVRHHSGTPLGYLFGQKDHLLFGDRRGKRAISPEEAEEARLNFLHNDSVSFQVFHWVYIVEASPK